MGFLRILIVGIVSVRRGWHIQPVLTCVLLFGADLLPRRATNDCIAECHVHPLLICCLYSRDGQNFCVGPKDKLHFGVSER